MSPWDMAVLRGVVGKGDPQKALFVVRSYPGSQRKGMACSVKTESGVFLVTCTDVAHPEDIGRNDGEGLVADRFCTLYPRHENKHRIKIRDVRNDDEFSFIPLPQSAPDSTFQLYDGNAKFANSSSCYSLAVIDNKESKRINWDYDNVNQRHVIQTDHDLGKRTIILGSPVLWSDGNNTFVVGVVGSDGDSLLLPIFFKENSHKIPGKKDEPVF